MLVAEIMIWVVSQFFTQVVLRTPLAELRSIGENLGTDEAALERLKDELIDFIEQYIIVLVVGFLVLWVITSLIGLARYCALFYAVSEQYVRQRMVISRAYRFALGRLGAVIGATAVAELAILGIVVVVIGITIAASLVFPLFAIPGFLAVIAIPIYLIVRWIFIWPAVLLEGKGPIGALSRSSELVKGNWWRVFGIMVVFLIMLMVMGLILNVSVGAIPIVGPLVVSILVVPVLPVLHILLYYDLRTRETPFNLDTLGGELNITGE